MSDLIANKYVKALVLDNQIENIEDIYNCLDSLSLAYQEDKFISIINAVDLSSDKKMEFIVSLLEKPNNNILNLIKLLAENKRLNILPYIILGLKQEISKIKNSYTGVVYTDDKKLKDSELKEIEDSFSKKFNITLSLSQELNSYDGIKVNIDGLGLEISFSKERLKSQMTEHILKAI